MTLGESPQSIRTPSDFSEYVRILLSRRRLLISFVGIACFVAVVLSLIGPETYHAQVTLLTEEVKGGFNLLDGGASVLDLVLGGGARRDGKLFIEMLGSRSVFTSVVEKCDLIRIYKLDKLPEGERMVQAIKTLANNSKFTETEGGVIRIDVDARTPFFPTSSKRRAAAEQAARIANTFSDELNRINQEKATSRARSVRTFLEEQINRTETAMNGKADSLVQLQLANRAVSLEEQTKATIDAAGELKGRIVATEMDLAILRRTMLPENPVVRAAEMRLDELRRQYRRLEYGPASRMPDADSSDLQIPFAALPAVAQQMANLMRDLKIQQTVYELLNEQYYRAKIQEMGDVPSLTVMDTAVPPVYRDRPKRKLVVLSTFVISLFIACLIAFGLEYRDRRRAF